MCSPLVLLLLVGLSLHCGRPVLLCRWEWREEGKAGNRLTWQQPALEQRDWDGAVLIMTCVVRTHRPELVHKPNKSKNYQVEVMRKSKAEKLNVRQAWNGVGGREWLVVFSLSSIPALADGRGGGDITVSERHYEKCRVSIPPLPLSCLTCLGCSSGNNFPVLCCSKKRVGVFVIV